MHLLWPGGLVNPGKWAKAASNGFYFLSNLGGERFLCSE